MGQVNLQRGVESSCKGLRNSDLCFVGYIFDCILKDPALIVKGQGREYWYFVTFSHPNFRCHSSVPRPGASSLHLLSIVTLLHPPHLPIRVVGRIGRP
jgi:hypothetical protein